MVMHTVMSEFGRWSNTHQVGVWHLLGALCQAMNVDVAKLCESFAHMYEACSVLGLTEDGSHLGLSGSRPDHVQGRGRGKGKGKGKGGKKGGKHNDAQGQGEEKEAAQPCASETLSQKVEQLRSVVDRIADHEPTMSAQLAPEVQQCCSDLVLFAREVELAVLRATGSPYPNDGVPGRLLFSPDLCVEQDEVAEELDLQRDLLDDEEMDELITIHIRTEQELSTFEVNPEANMRKAVYSCLKIPFSIRFHIICGGEMLAHGSFLENGLNDGATLDVHFLGGACKGKGKGGKASVLSKGKGEQTVRAFALTVSVETLLKLQKVLQQVRAAIPRAQSLREAGQHHGEWLGFKADQVPTLPELLQKTSCFGGKKLWIKAQDMYYLATVFGDDAALHSAEDAARLLKTDSFIRSLLVTIAEPTDRALNTSKVGTDVPPEDSQESMRLEETLELAGMEEVRRWYVACEQLGCAPQDLRATLMRAIEQGAGSGLDEGMWVGIWHNLGRLDAFLRAFGGSTDTSSPLATMLRAAGVRSAQAVQVVLAPFEPEGWCNSDAPSLKALEGLSRIQCCVVKAEAVIDEATGPLLRALQEMQESQSLRDFLQTFLVYYNLTLPYDSRVRAADVGANTV